MFASPQRVYSNTLHRTPSA